LLKKRFCGAEGLDVINLSDFNSGDLVKNGLEILDGPLAGTLKEHLLWLTQTVRLSIQSKFLKLLNQITMLL
jgi:peroxiredoxin